MGSGDQRDTRPYFDESTARLAERIEEAKRWFLTLHEVYVELAHREAKGARVLRADLAKLFETTSSYFPWPTTEVRESSGKLDESVFVYEQGVLGYMGYKVGKSGVSRRKREALLADAFAGALPSVNSAEYMDAWGKPGSPKRLRKMAFSIAEFAKTNKKNDAKKYGEAIRDWESDLAYLKATYYDGKHSFAWPESTA